METRAVAAELLMNARFDGETDTREMEKVCVGK
jgi:hypothetical protein